jgi:outer membrane protein assembly factor BamB
MRAPYSPLRFLFFPFLIALTMGCLYAIYQHNPHLMAQETLFDELRLKRGSDITTVKSKLDISADDMIPSHVLGQSLQRHHMYSETIRPTHRWTFYKSSKLADLEEKFNAKTDSIAADSAGVYLLTPKKFSTYKLSGEAVWHFNLPENDTFANGPISTTSRLVTLATYKGSIYTFEKTSGQLIWYSKSNEHYLRTPVFGKKNLYIYSELKSGQLWNLLIADPATGEILKKISSLEEPITGELAFNDSESMAYYNTESGRTYALNLEKGEAVWSVESEFGFEAAPAVSGDRIYVVNNQGGLSAYDNRNARLIWTTALDAKVSGGVSLLPEGFKAYVLDKNGYIHAVNTRTGKREWRFSTSQTGPLQSIMLLRMRGSSFADLKVMPHIRFWTIWSFCAGFRLCIFDSKEGQPYVRLDLKDTSLVEPYFDKEGEDMWYVGSEGSALTLYHYMEDKKLKALKEAEKTAAESAAATPKNQ